MIGYPGRVNKAIFISAGVNGFERKFPIDSVSRAWYSLFSGALAAGDTARAALEGFFGPHTDDLWRTLLFDSGLTGEETDSRALRRLISTMQVAHPIARLCARSLAVRVAVYDRLVDRRQESEVSR